MEIFKGINIHHLTEVSIITNTDGIHSKEEVVGYIAEEPFVVLTAWINKYLISSYNERLYPVGFCSFSYTIGLKDIGSRYHPSNLTKHYFSDLSSFESMVCSIKVAELYDSNKDEQFRLLSSILENRPDIQKAIDCQSYIDALNDKDDLKQDYIVKIMDTLKSIDFGIDPDLDCLASYIFKQAIENINDL